MVEVASVWGLLDTYNKNITSLAAIIFGIASTAVAIAAYRLSRYNNFGLPPLLMHVSAEHHGRGDYTEVRGVMEVWNRSKLPIEIHFMTVRFQSGNFLVENQVVTVSGLFWERLGFNEFATGDITKKLEAGEKWQTEFALAATTRTKMSAPAFGIYYLDPGAGQFSWVTNRAGRRWHYCRDNLLFYGKLKPPEIGTVF